MTGLVIRDINNRVLVDMTSSISQTQGSVDTNSALNGSVGISPLPANKNRWFNIVPLQDLQLEKGKKPGVTISGNTLSWNYSFATNGWGYFAANCRIYYGYY